MMRLYGFDMVTGHDKNMFGVLFSRDEILVECLNHNLTLHCRCGMIRSATAVRRRGAFPVVGVAGWCLGR